MTSGKPTNRKAKAQASGRKSHAKPNRSGNRHDIAQPNGSADNKRAHASAGTGASVGQEHTHADDLFPFCPAVEICGGCTRVNVPYPEQLAAKDLRIQELFSPVFPSADIRPIIGMDDPFHYRNKVTSPFAPGKQRRTGAKPNGGKAGKRSRAQDGPHRNANDRQSQNREILTGMYAAGTHRIVPVEHCLLENEDAQKVVRTVKSLMGKFQIAPYDEVRHIGFMRHAVVRVGHESGEMLLTLVTNGDEFPASKSFCRELARRCPKLTTVVQNVNTRQTNVILGEHERRLYGPGFILDTLCGLSFRISSQSFYQVNSTQTTVLYEKAIELAHLEGCMAIDAYCGTGTIGLVAAKRGASRVIGVDSVASAIRDARENARHNGVKNAQFHVADAGAFMRETATSGERVDVVLMDPPRAGSSPEFLDALAVLQPARIVYVSCNPDTQLRDLRQLSQSGYVVETVQPVDMFPHTEHVESIASLSLGK